MVYNTESCTIFAHDAKSGKLLWSYWLGDPLMSSPSIAAGRVFAAYPASGRVAGSPAVGVGTFNANDNNATINPAQGAQQILPQVIDDAACLGPEGENCLTFLVEDPVWHGVLDAHRFVGRPPRQADAVRLNMTKPTRLSHSDEPRDHPPRDRRALWFRRALTPPCLS